MEPDLRQRPEAGARKGAGGAPSTPHAVILGEGSEGTRAREKWKKNRGAGRNRESDARASLPAQPEAHPATSLRRGQATSLQGNRLHQQDQHGIDVLC